MIQMYESELKRVNPGITNIRYDLADLFAFIDKFYDVSCLKYFLLYFHQIDLIQKLNFTNHVQKIG